MPILTATSGFREAKVRELKVGTAQFLPLGIRQNLIMSTSTSEKQFAISSARGIVDELVFNMAKHERNPFTFEHVKTLLAGKTVGGYQLQDQNQILRLKDAWDELFSLVESGQPFLSKSSVLRLHGIVGEQEALEWGIFRSGPVTISGTSYQPPDALKLDVLFDQLIEAMSELDTPVDRGITLFISCARNQFFGIATSGWVNF